jgi:hypothetical protein
MSISIKFVPVHVMKTYRSRSSLVPLILEFDTIWGLKVASRPGRYTTEKKIVFHCIGGWVGPRVDPEISQKIKLYVPYTGSNLRSSSPYVWLKRIISFILSWVCRYYFVHARFDMDIVLLLSTVLIELLLSYVISISYLFLSVWLELVKLNRIIIIIIIIVVIITVDVRSSMSFDASFNYGSCCSNIQISMHSRFQFTLL